MPNYNSDEIKDLQSAVLGTKLDEAGFTGIGPIPQRTLPTTSEKIITRALNAHENSLDLNETAVNSLGARYFNVVGNELHDDKNNFESLGGNLINTVLSLKRAVQPPGIDYTVKAMQDKSIYIATSDGSDASDGANRGRALKTLSEVNGLAKNGCSLALNIYKYKTEEESDPKAVPPEFSPAYSYAAGDLVSFSYTYENVVPGAGFRPGLDMYAYGWRFVCIDEVDDTIAVEPWSASEAYEAGDIVSMDSANYFSPRITYICLAGNTDSPPPASDYTEDPTEFWCPISAHNPVLAIEEGDLKLERLSGVTLHSEGQLVIALGGIGISKCSFLDCAAPFAASGALSISRLSSVRFQKRLYASSISMRHVGTMQFISEVGAGSHIYLAYNGQAAFEGNVSAGAYIAHKSSGNVLYAGTVAVALTDNENRTAIGISGGTVATFELGITARAYAEGEGNYASGLLVDSGSRAVLGPSAENTFGGFNYAIYVEGGATVQCNSWQTHMQALNNYNYPVYGVYVGEGGMFVSGKGTAYDWENSYEYPYNNTKDRTEPRGVYVDLKKGTSEGSGGGGSGADIAATAYRVGTQGHLITTDIEADVNSGVVRLEFKAWGYFYAGWNFMMYDTVVEFNAMFSGIESLQQLNMGCALPPATVYANVDGYWAIYIAGTPSAARVEAVVTYLLAGESVEEGLGETPVDKYVKGTLDNRVSAIDSIDKESIYSMGGEFTVESDQIGNSLMASDMSREIFVAVEDGNDNNNALRQERYGLSCKTVKGAMQAVAKNADVRLEINKGQAYGYWGQYIEIQQFGGEFATYACVYEGHLFVTTGAGPEGSVPSLASQTAWRHVNIEEPTRGEFSVSEWYYPGDTVLHGNLTYVCVKTGEPGQIPTLSETADPYWHVCGEFNPIVINNEYFYDPDEDKTSITNLGNVSIFNGTGNLEIIFIGNLDVSDNKKFTSNVPMFVTGKLIANNIGSYTWNESINVGSIESNQTGSGIFSGPVTVRGHINHAACSSVLYKGPVKIIKTDSLSVSGIRATDNTRLSMLGTVSINGLEGVNTGSGIESGTLSTISTYGDCTVSGFARQIHASSGGAIENNSPSYVLGKGGNTAASATAIQVDQGSKVIVNKGSLITRNNSMTDSVNAKAVLYTYT